MDCRQIASQLARLSADDLPSSTAVAMWEHLTRCPECEQEWKTFQTTLLILSTAPQPLITAEQSAQIWQNCSEQLHQRIEERRLAAQRPAFFSWARSQPRWGWAALGGAIAVLGGVWWLTPQDSQDSFSTQVAQILPGQTTRSLANNAGMLGMNEAPSPGPLVTFQQPPPIASAMVNNHTEMTFAPFADQVGTNLVSNAAITHRVNITQPEPNGAVPESVGVAPSDATANPDIANGSPNSDAVATTSANAASDSVAGTIPIGGDSNAAALPARNAYPGATNSRMMAPATNAPGQTP